MRQAAHSKLVRGRCNADFIQQRATVRVRALRLVVKQADRKGEQGRSIITQGMKVRIKEGPSLEGRPHLMRHAKMKDIGIVSGPAKQSPKMATLYVIVRFDDCGHDHRLLKDELEEVA